MLRFCACVLFVACQLSLLTPVNAAGMTSAVATQDRHLAQTDDDLDAAANSVREFSLLESTRDFEQLYELMHPDSRAVAPRTAVVGWYESYFVNREAREARITEAVYEPWTWGVTGVTYENAVTVRFVQPYLVNGAPEDVVSEVHVVPFESSWGWFFGASASFVEEQIALYGDDGSATLFSLSQGSADEAPIPREILFPDPLHAHVDAFWQARFDDVGRDYRPPAGVIPFDTPIVTACGRADPDEEAAFYCVIDEKIYYSASFRQLIESQIGDFAWVVVVAHEWGHHVQAQLGFELGASPDLAGEVLPIEIEQQADCLAGAYSIDAEISGWLDPGDVDEALYMTEISGDPPGTAWNDPRAHGSGVDRIDAFLDGYSGGIGVCDLDLSLPDPAG